MHGKNINIKILGCGGAGGVPSISTGWGNCDPNNFKNRRSRSSILVEHVNTKILIDASPDLREQFLRAKTTRINAVVFTHAHADHTHGINDLREINRVINGPLKVWADKKTILSLKQYYSYAFEDDKNKQAIYKPWLLPEEIKDRKRFKIGDIELLPFKQNHGLIDTMGYRIKDFAYSTDIKSLPETSKKELRGLKLWIIGVLTNDKNHKTHVSLDKALEWIKELKPRTAVITHMGCGLDYDEVTRKCPESVFPAYDGMELEI